MQIRKILLALPFFIASCTSNDFDPTGTYILQRPSKTVNGETFGYFGEIQIKQLEQNKMVLSLFVCRGAPGYCIGTIRDTLELKNKTLKYTCSSIDEPGSIYFYFTKKGINVIEKNADQSSFCGFGHNVHAKGFYQFKSRRTKINEDPSQDRFKVFQKKQNSQ